MLYGFTTFDGLVDMYKQHRKAAHSKQQQKNNHRGQSPKTIDKSKRFSRVEAFIDRARSVRGKRVGRSQRGEQAVGVPATKSDDFNAGNATRDAMLDATVDASLGNIAVTREWNVTRESQGSSDGSSMSESQRGSDAMDGRFDYMDAAPTTPATPSAAALHTPTKKKNEMSSPASSPRTLVGTPPPATFQFEQTTKGDIIHHVQEVLSSSPPSTDRADWDSITSIPHYEFKNILAQHLHHASTSYTEEDFSFISEHRGGYNYVRLYSLLTGPNAGVYAVKVPSVGTRKAQWCAHDAYMLRSEFGTLKLIGERTGCPVPKVMGYDDTLENDLGAPFIVMRAVEGVPATDIWFDVKVGEDGDEEYDVENADEASAARLAVRQTFLTSLAHAMAELRHLEFGGIGKLSFDGDEGGEGEPSVMVGPSYHAIPNPHHPDQHFWAEHSAFASSDSYWKAGLDASSSVHPAFASSKDKAIAFIMRTLIESPPFDFSSTSRHQKEDEREKNEHEEKENMKESFVLRHPDLNFQNIFCDPLTGHVTGIIDWQECATVPRCIGYPSVPSFLMEDWLPGYSLWHNIHSPWALQQYRNIYAQAMTEATAVSGMDDEGIEGDGRFTLGSPLYQAVLAALYGGSQDGCCEDVVRKVLRAVPELGDVDVEKVLERLGEGSWFGGEEFVGWCVGRVAGGWE